MIMALLQHSIQEAQIDQAYDETEILKLVYAEAGIKNLNMDEVARHNLDNELELNQQQIVNVVRKWLDEVAAA